MHHLSPFPARPPRLAIDGVLLLDKPLGCSSSQALLRVKRLLGAKKAGHTGSLDPLATGLLPLCLGEATKFSHCLLEASKTYEATLRLGVVTSTGDAEGEVLRTSEPCRDADAVRAALTHFRGAITQVPPMYSALKRDGKPLYAYARAGREVKREARALTIYELALLRAHPERAEFALRVICSKGTYVRTLAEDIGAVLGCGAHLSALRRTAVGAFMLDDAVTLESLEAAAGDAKRWRAWLRPVDTLLRDFPAARLNAALAARFCQGQRLRLAADFRFDRGGVNETVSHEAPQVVRVYDESNRLLGTAHFLDSVLAPERLVALPQ